MNAQNEMKVNRFKMRHAFGQVALLCVFILSLSPIGASHAFAQSEGDDEQTFDGASEQGEAPQKPRKPVSADLTFKRGKAPKKKKLKEEDLELDVEDAPSPVSTSTGAKPAAVVAVETITPAVQAKLAQADALAKKQQWPQVVSLLKPVMQQLPREGLFLMANAYSMTKSPADEVRALDLSSHKYPNDAAVLTRLGLAYSKLNRKAEAMDTLYLARTANAQYKPAFEALLAELQKQEEFYEARTLVQDMIKKFGDEPKYISSFCALLTRDAFLQKAVETCEEATKKDPKDFKNYINLALSLKDKLEPAEAAKILAQATSLFPRADAVFTTQGSVFMDAKNYVAAFGAFKRATEIAPKSSDAWVGLANANIELHKYKDALTAYVNACKVDQHAVKDFRAVAARLHHEGENDWQAKFTDAVSLCTSQY